MAARQDLPGKGMSVRGAADGHRDSSLYAAHDCPASAGCAAGRPGQAGVGGGTLCPGLALSCVANSRWFDDVVGKQIATVAASLPPAAAAAAQERGRSRDLWATVAELLAELGEGQCTAR